MQLKTLAKGANKEYAAARASAETSIMHLIQCGDFVTQAKAQVEDDWNGWVDANLDFGYTQATKYLRIAKHRVQAAQLAHDNDGMSINDLVSELPRTAEEPVITEADASDVAGQTGSVSNKRDKDDWQTPGEYVDAARAVMGSIDLDPFSSVRANGDIKAKRFFTVTDDAYNITWAERGSKTVWMNPPYSHGGANKATEKFLSEYDNGSFNQAIVLMNSATDTHWFHDMCRYADAICLTEGRISFISGDKEMSSNTKGQVFFYFGSNPIRFKEVFIKHGLVVSVEDYL